MKLNANQLAQTDIMVIVLIRFAPFAILLAKLAQLSINAPHAQLDCT